MLTIHVWPKRLKEFLLTHPLYKSPFLTGTALEKTEMLIPTTPRPPTHLLQRGWAVGVYSDGDIANALHLHSGGNCASIS